MQTRRSQIPFILLALLCLFGLSAADTACAQQSPSGTSPLPAPIGYVNDYANVIDPATEDRLETVLTNLKGQAQIEFAVVTVRTTGGQDIFDYTLTVARGWGIGAKDGERMGMIMLVAVDDRKYFTQVSRHLEGDLPDGLLGQIQREQLVPQLKRGNYSQGIADTAAAYVQTLAQSRGFSIEGLGERAPVSRPRSRTQSRGAISPCCIGIIILVIIIVLFSNRGRGGGGSGGGGLLNALLLGSLLNSGGRSSGWSGGGFGGSGGGSSGGGGFGGFGGGGDFGGGGAGGNW